MYRIHCPNRSLFIKDGYTYLPKLSIKLKEDNDYTKNCTGYIKNITSWQDKETIEGFNAVLGEVGKVINIPDDAVNISLREDIDNVQDCEGGFKKFINYRCVIFFNLKNRN